MAGLLLVSTGAFAQFRTATLQAAGLTCSLCSRAVYKALTAVPFVKEVKADIQNSSYVISFKEGQQPDFDMLAKAVEQAGFSVAHLRVNMHFNGLPVENDTHVKIDGKTFHFLHISSQSLEGDMTITLLDKDFVSPKEYKKNAQYTTMKCYQTGLMESCCSNKPGTDKKTVTVTERVYHVTI